jgi:hypothetical protein
MVAATLKLLDEWYNEPSAQAGDRPQLLSKLALLELCGWIEGEFDRLIQKAEGGRLRDPKWLAKTVVNTTNGFTYSGHLRRMFSTVFGEIFVQRIENDMETNFPGDLDRFQTTLNELWNRRCSFAHADFVANVAAQRVFDAPSWSRAQHATVTHLITEFDTAMTRVLAHI